MRSMDVTRLKDLLDKVRAGTSTIDEALAELRDLPFRDLGFATVDHHRALRTGIPEVVFGEPKTADHIVTIAEEIARKGQNVLITRVDTNKAQAIRSKIADLKYAPV